MSPHDPPACPRTVDADVSQILVYPRHPEPVRPGQGTDLVIPIPTGRSTGRVISGIGPFGWANIGFVLASCLIALFCTLFVSENVQHFRRRANAADDLVYLRPGFDSGTAALSQDPSQLVSTMQLNRSQRALLSPESLDRSPLQALSPLLPSTQNESSALSPNDRGVANDGMVRNSSPTNSDSTTSNSAAKGEVSRATASKSGSSNSMQRSSSVRSSTTRLTRNSRKQTVSGESRSLASRQNSRRSVNGGVGRIRAASSSPRTTGGLKSANLQMNQRGSRAEFGAERNQMSMHSIGQGSVGIGVHGGMNPMHMEGGMLAQPAMGGVTGNGLGGIGQHGGHLRR